MVVDKPSGLLTIPTPKKEARTLTSILNLRPCHRLDRETSGLIIYAKTRGMQKQMMQLFKEKKIKKQYFALVRGNLNKAQGEIKYPIEGLPAVSRYNVLEKRKGFDIVAVSPLTGRTNQIRIHFKQVGHPLLGETKYAFRRDFPIKAKRLCLHARGLEFTHPVTKKYLRLEIALPKDLQDFLERHN